MTDQTRDLLRHAAIACMCYWPNSHLGEYTRREDLASFFRRLRCRIEAGESVQIAAHHLLSDAYAHMDM